ncbi:MAG: single-stranded-DNA-specific exonuclease RecJ [Lachnospiraceae bacterium]|nr:single-stranded-DNA-specific exonuclease RecJ [Lachnospiraceae bacterium]
MEHRVFANYESIGRNFGVSPIIARLALNRGVRSANDMAKYIRPQMDDLNDPHMLKDMDLLCDILKEKMEAGKSIRVIGDYDVDGIMSTFILVDGIKRLGGVVDYRIPERLKDGYGLNINLIKEALEENIDTIVTCDNGIAASKEITFGVENGLTILVTDHHEIPINEPLPPAMAVVDPKREDSEYPFREICGAMVAYKVIQILGERFGKKAFERNYLIHAAFATICDVMPLLDENRSLVKFGLKEACTTQNIGIKALIAANNLEDVEISVYHVGFVLGPCINASGRLRTATEALELLVEQDYNTAYNKAVKLATLNRERKDLTLLATDEAYAMLEAKGEEQDRVLVVYLPECHESLAGIVAGRIRERYYRPVIVLTKGEEGVKGSARSIPEYDMFVHLSQCKELFTKFGGHSQAAGLSMKEENIEPLRIFLNEHCELSEDDLTEKIRFDMQLPIENVEIGLAKELALLEPYGTGNSSPLFAVRGARIMQIFYMGEENKSIRLKLLQENGHSAVTALIFNEADRFNAYMKEKYGGEVLERLLTGYTYGDTKYTLDLLYQMNVNEYNGRESAQIVIKDYR